MLPVLKNPADVNVLCCTKTSLIIKVSYIGIAIDF
jgi:hypothetical protein